MVSSGGYRCLRASTSVHLTKGVGLYGSSETAGWSIKRAVKIPAPICLRPLAHNERGMALPFALFAMIAGMALASAAVVATINVQQGSHRDSSTKSALAVADAGANIARTRINRYAVVLADHPCMRMGASGVLEGAEAEGDGWCPEVEGSVGGGTYVYRVSPAGATCGEYKLCVVSTGTVSNTSRRIEVAYNESAIQETIKTQAEGEEGGGEEKSGTETEGESVAIEGLIGQDGIELSGNADVRVGIGTNGDIVATGNADVCGDARHGVGKKFEKTQNAKQCPGYVETEGNKSLPPVSSFMPSDIATNNSDYRLEECTKTQPTKEPAGCESDAYSGQRNSTIPWDPSTRTITLAANDTLTVSGGDYWVCQVNLSGNSQLFMASGVQVRFFFDTPENCGLSSGASQISLTGNTKIASTDKTVMPAFYLLGSTTMPSGVNIAGNASTTDEFVIYGPNTDIQISGNGTYKGVMAGKTITINGNGRFENDANYEPPAEVRPVTETGQSTEGEPGGGQSSEETVTTARYFSPQFYVECSGLPAPGAAPNASC